MKTCGKCKQHKDETEFPFKNKLKNIKNSVCSECQKEYKLKHYYSNKKQYYDRNKVTIIRLRELVDDFKKKHPCERCGESDICCLDFHHLNPDEKDFEIGNTRNIGSERKILKEISKCIILCANCHRKLHAGRFGNINTECD